MKKEEQPSSNAVKGAAERMSQGIVYSNDDLWKDEPDPIPAKPVETIAKPAQPPVVLRQRRRQRKNKA